MKKIVVFTEHEQELINQLKHELAVNGNLNEISIIDNNEQSLHNLSDAVTGYPSIFSEQHLISGLDVQAANFTVFEYLAVANREDFSLGWLLGC